MISIGPPTLKDPEFPKVVKLEGAKTPIVCGDKVTLNVATTNCEASGLVFAATARRTLGARHALRRACAARLPAHGAKLADDPLKRRFFLTPSKAEVGDGASGDADFVPVGGAGDPLALRAAAVSCEEHSVGDPLQV